MNKIFLIVCLLISFISFGQLDQRAKDSIELFAPTPKGEPIGEKYSKDIGAEGGELVSPGNGIELIIPPGALSKNTTISVQAATNYSLDGVGNAFHLEPSGIQFKVPAKLVIHYDPKKLNGSSPHFLAIVFQDEKGSWFSIGKFKIDTIANTISGNITHFSFWAASWSFHLRPEKTKVKVSKKVFIRTYPQPCSWADPRDRTEAVLGIFGKDLQNPRTWFVNGFTWGNAENGTVDQSGTLLENGVYYKAPELVPGTNPVEVKLQIDGVEIFDREVTMIKTCKITVYDKHYEVKMVTTMKGGGKEVWGGNMTYRDEGKFVISVDEDPKLLDIDNRLEQLKYDNCGIKIVNPKTCTGMIHVTGIKSWKITPANPPQIPYNTLEIFFIHKSAEFTAFTYDCPPPPGATGNARGTMVAVPMMSKMPSMPMVMKFKLIEGEQVIQKIGNPGDELYVKLTVKRMEE
jgi:ZU5 domain